MNYNIYWLFGTITRLVRGNLQISNLVANFVSSSFSLTLPLIFNVIYFRVLGSESYGLIGFYGSLVALAGLLDMGLSQTTVREFARRTASADRAQDMRIVLFTLQGVYIFVGLILGSMMLVFAHWIATSWLQRTQLSEHEVSTAVVMMGGMLALSFPGIVFNATLRGLQRQVLVSGLGIAISIARGGTALGCLYLLKPTSVTFFSAQLALSVIEIATLGVITWRILPPSPAPLRFNLGFLRSVWRFSSAHGLAVIMGQLMMMSGTIILSSLLPLESFGLYSLGVNVASIMPKLITPFNNAYFPHLVELSEKGDSITLSHTYHLITQVASAILISVGLLLSVYTYSVLLLLTGNATNAASLAPIARLLVIAYTVNALMWLPHSLQLAQGIAWIALRFNIIQSAIFLPLLVILTPRFGMYAPASLWLAVNIIQFPFFIVMTHRVALRSEMWRWLRGAIIYPACGASAVLALGWLLAPSHITWPITASWLAANGLVTFLVALACSPKVATTLLGRS
jgi:O-antigen/teichoic acid export membrane protein